MEQKFDLFKKRDLSALVSDTIEFFKILWKPYFRSYIIINGLLLIALIAVFYMLFYDFFKNFGPSNLDAFSGLIDSSPFHFVAYLLIFLFISLLYTVFSTLYPMVFLRKMKSGYVPQHTSDYLNEIKGGITRFFLFIIISFFIIVPLISIFLAFGIALSFILLGIPLLIMGLPAIFVWVSQAAYVYIEENTDYFSALSKGWKILFSKFFHYSGATIIMYIMVYILSSLFTFIPSMVGLSSVLTTGHNQGNTSMGVMVSLLYILGLVVSYVGYNLLYVQQGLIYYSSQESDSYQSTFRDIDNIGQNEA